MAWHGCAQTTTCWLPVNMTSFSLEIIGDAAAKPETMLSGPLRARPLCSTPLIHFRGAERLRVTLWPVTGAAASKRDGKDAIEDVLKRLREGFPQFQKCDDLCFADHKVSVTGLTRRVTL